MFPNWTGWKTVKLILFVLTGLVQVLPANLQTIASTALAAIGSIVVVLSGTGAGPAMAKVGKVAVTVLTLGFLATTQSACSPSQTAELQSIENLVLQDIMAGRQLPQIEQDVANLVAGQPGVDVVLLVDDALQFLVDAGVIPTGWIPTAQAMAKTEHAKAQANRGAP